MLSLQPILTYIIKNEPAVTPAVFCSLQLQSAERDVCPSNDPRFEWTVELPEPSNEVSIPVFSDLRNIIYFDHLL